MPRSQLTNLARTIIAIHEKNPEAKIKVRAADGSYIEIDNREIKETIKGSESQTTALDKKAFGEAYDYLENAKERLNSKKPEGYSDCKTNCRCALISALRTLTHKEKVSEALEELHRQGIFGKREKEFIETFDKLLETLHGIDSKKGPHPPMTRSAYDAEFAFNITQSTIHYIVNQATHPRV